MIVYDLEVFAHDYLVGFYDGETYYQYWNDEQPKILDFYNEHKNDIWVGHNSLHYDSPLLKLILLNQTPEQIKENSDIVINGGDITRKVFNDKRGPAITNAVTIQNITIYDWDIMNDKVWYSLKQAEGYMGLSIDETEVDFNLDRKLTKEEKELTNEYNRSDLYATWQEALIQVSAIKIRLALLQEYNLPKEYISLTNQKLTGEILDGQYMTYTDQLDPYDLSVAPIEINNPEYHKAVEYFTECKQLDPKGKIELEIAGITHTLGLGGIHAGRPKFYYEGEIWDIDVASYYPNMLINFDICSRAMKHPENFPKIVQKRMDIKKKVKDYKQSGREEELTATEKLMPDGLKIIINTVSGAMKAKFSKLYDERRNNLMCISGQLLLIDLIEKLEPYIELIQANTDGIFVIPKNKEKIQEEMDKWCKKTGLVLEIDKYKKMYQKDVNNYVAESENGKIHLKGAYVNQYYNDTDRRQTRRCMDIIDKAVVDYLLYDTPVEETICNKDNLLWKYQNVKKIGSMYVAVAQEIYGELTPVHNKCNRIFSAKDKEKYGKVKKLKEGKTTYDNIEGVPEHCIIINDDIRDVKIGDMLDIIDLQFYIDEAKKRIVDFILPTKEKTKGKKYSLETDWENTKLKLGRK